jgi:hypothetical protein
MKLKGLTRSLRHERDAVLLLYSYLRTYTTYHVLNIVTVFSGDPVLASEVVGVGLEHTLTQAGRDGSQARDGE